QLFKSLRHPNLMPLIAFWLKDEAGCVLDESQVNSERAPQAKEGTALRGTVQVGVCCPSPPSELIIVMSLGEMSLWDRMAQCQREGLAGIPPHELLEYMRGAALAIDFLNSPRHDLGHGLSRSIQHCDIKPQNILIAGGQAQVCDFGLARELGQSFIVPTLAATPAYGAPELLEGKPPSAATDQYSLAISY